MYKPLENLLKRVFNDYYDKLSGLGMSKEEFDQGFSGDHGKEDHGKGDHGKKEEKKEKPQRKTAKEKHLEEAFIYFVDENEDAKKCFKKYTNIQLKDECRKKGLKVSGNKADLLYRLDNPNAPDSVAKRKGKQTRFKGRDVSHIINKMKKTTTISAEKNEQGYYIHKETNFIIHPETKKVYAKWYEPTKVKKQLDKHDILTCQHYNLQFELPENLDHGSIKIVDPKLEELNDEDFKEEIDEEDEEVDSEGDE